MNFIDLYCGAGLGARGAVAAGGIPIAAVDLWGRATETYRANFPGALTMQGCVGDFNPATLGIDEPIDLLLASPECTSHSLARGNRPADRESQDSALTFLPWVDEFNPRWIVLENVTRIRRWEGYERLLGELAGREYVLSETVLNSADFGAPQSRRRLYIVCGLGLEPPTQAQITGQINPYRTARDIVDFDARWPSRPLYREGRAKATIERAERAMATLGRGVPFLIVYYGSDYAGGWQSLDVPLRTVTTIDRFGLVTWRDDEPMLRMLQPPELLRAMGADDHILTVGTRRDKVKLCGNGICSPVMSAICTALEQRNTEIDDDREARAA